MEMKHRHKFLIGALVVVALVAVLALLAVGGQGALAAPGIIYVDAGAVGGNDGSSWDDAYTDLQPALAAATAGDEIWVAAGTYKPTSGTDRHASFQMVNGVEIYGGFDPGSGVTKFRDRDWVTYATILSGDIGTAGDNTDNSYHVLYHPAETDLDSSAILDGFTITGGNADGDYPHYCGGGMYNEGSSPTLTNCTFTENFARLGGGMHNNSDSSPALSDCSFVSNEAVSAGGMFNYTNTSPLLTNCTFLDNLASSNGGGMYNMYGLPVLTNCAFSGNSAGYGGGGMYNYHAAPALTNCTFWGNMAGVDGGGGMFNTQCSPTLTNSILWADTPYEIRDYGEVSVITYSDVQGGYAGTGNIDADPLFVDPGKGDFHLGAGSPCIDAGNNGAPNLPSHDFEGDDRVLDGDGDDVAIVDMGVDEVIILTISVEIDITPNTPSNMIRLGSGADVPVAVLTTAEFDAASVDPGTVLFAGAGQQGWVLMDVDGDDNDDLLLYFDPRDLDLDENDRQATLIGETFAGVPIEGTDRVKVKE
jgi:hypothetical protein